MTRGVRVAIAVPPQSLSFFVAGTPRAQGSITRMPNGAMLYGTSQEAHDEVMAWRASVAHAAREHRVRFPRGVRVEYLFVLPRPPSVTRTAPWVKPDCDKLARAVGDALQLAGIIKDDSRIVQLLVTKVYAAAFTIGGAVATAASRSLRTPGVHISIEEIA